MRAKHTPEPWRSGILLKTRVTERYTDEQWERQSYEERRRVFVNFHPSDQGKSRRLIATCELPEDAARIVECVNAMEGIEKPQEFMEVVRKLELDAYQRVAAERDELKAKLDHWRNEVIAIRVLVKAHEEESTFDEVERLTRNLNGIIRERIELARWKREAMELYKPIAEFEHPELKLGDSRVETVMRLVAERDELKKVLEETYELGLKTKQQQDKMAIALKDIVNVGMGHAPSVGYMENLILRAKAALKFAGYGQNS